jgi:hypothetical protein
VADGARAVIDSRPATGPLPPETTLGEVPLCRISKANTGGPTLVWRWPDSIAAAISHPDGRSRLTLGPRAGHPSRALTVELDHAEVTAVDRDGLTAVAAHCRAAGTLQTGDRLTLSGPPAPPPTNARPWTLYRVAAVPPAPPGEPGSGAQLRIELGEIRKGTQPDSRRLVVVHRPYDSSQPASIGLTVDAGGTVTVNGNLKVTGVLSVPGGSTANAALSYLARRATELTSDANVLRNSMPGMGLTFSNRSAVFSGADNATLKVSFHVGVPSGQADLANVFVYMVIASGQSRLSQAFEVRDASIAAGSSVPVSKSIDVTPLARGSLLQIDVVAVGRPATPGAAGRRSDPWHAERIR